MAGETKPLDGKVAWVTGSSRGLGRVIATHLGTLGAKVVVHGSTPTSTRAFGEGESLAAVAEEIAQASSADVLAVHGDLTDPEAVERIVGEVVARLGQIDILVANAGGDIGAAGAQAEGGGWPTSNDALFIRPEDLRAVLDRNLMSCIYVCRAVVPAMMERKRGWVVTFGSVSGLFGHANQATYSVAKAAVHQYTRALAAQLRPYNIPVNCIAPGGTVTARFVATGQAQQDRLDATDRQDTLERYGVPEEVARTVAFLVSEPGPFISGQVIRVDGGSQLWPA